MNNNLNARTRVLIIAGVVTLACLLLGLGAAAAGGAVYALTQGTEWLGVGNRENATALPTRATADGDAQGIVVAAVVEDGPAAAAGVERGDILLQVDGQAVDRYRDLRDALDRLEPGDEVELRLRHGDDERRLTATLDERDGKAFLGLVPCCPMREDGIIRRLPEPIRARGALITNVIDDSPADAAGLREGDIVLAVDGQELATELTLADAIRAYQPGDRVTLTVRASAAEDAQELTLELGEHPDMEGVAYLGVTYAPAPGMRLQPLPRQQVPEVPRINPDIERFRDLIPEDLLQATVIEVDPESPAEEAGLRAGDVILSVDGEPVTTPQDVIRAVTRREPGDVLTLTVRRPGEDDDQDQELELSAALGQHPDDPDDGARPYLGVKLGVGMRHLRRFRGESEPNEWHFEFDLPEDWELRFDLDALLDYLESRLPPGDDAEGWEGLLDGQGV